MNVQEYIQSGVIESYVLGIADTLEAAEVEQLSQQFPEIKQAIDEFEALLEKAAFADAIPVPTSIKANLMSELQNEFVLLEKTKVISLVDNNKEMPIVNGRGWVRYLAAASIILLVVSSALNIYLYNEYNTVNNNYTALLKENTTITADNKVYQTKMLDLYNGMQIMSDPTMQKIVMAGVAGKENSFATIFWDNKSKDVYLLANKLPQAAKGKQYQLWAIVDGVAVDAGMLEDCNGLCKLKNIPKAQAFAITLEKEGGNLTPTMDQMYVLGKVG